MRGTIIVLPAARSEVSVELTHPQPDQILTVPGSVRLEASVNAEGAEVVQVEFFSGETVLGLVPTSPYTLLVNLPEGEHVLTAVVKGSDGETTASDPVLVTVSRPDPAAFHSQVVLEDGVLALSGSGGVGPLILQQTPGLTPPDWETAAVLSDTSHSAHPAGAGGFFRVADAAHYEGIPFSIHLTGDAERPDPVITEATGSGLLRLEGNILTFDVRYEGLSGPATAAHIHGPATAAEAAGVLIDLAPFNGDAFGTEGTLSGRVLTFNVRYQGLSGAATAAHIHGPASADTAAGVLIDLAPYNGGAFGSSGILSGTVALT
jgi:hypothetical protein